MVNSGAIIVSSLIKNNWNMADRFDYVSLFFVPKFLNSDFMIFVSLTGIPDSAQ